MRKAGRAIELDTGTILTGAVDAFGLDYGNAEYGKRDPNLVVPGFPDANTFYEMGWEWQSSYIRWFLVVGGKEVTLWTLRDASRIPQNPSKVLMNLWHPSEHWDGRGKADPAANDATLAVDYFSFTK
ncbi:hypothetical protein EON77_14635 [bacterium]|nr:MAG: hypothetical protein EON77_14635 [bacterium]